MTLVCYSIETNKCNKCYTVDDTAIISIYCDDHKPIKYGCWIYYTIDGKLKEKGMYDNGKKVGKWEIIEHNSFHEIKTIKDYDESK